MLKIAFSGLGDHALQSHAWHLAFNPGSVAAKTLDYETVAALPPPRRQEALASLGQHPDVKIVAAFDPESAKFARLKHHLGIEPAAYTNKDTGYTSMLRCEDIDGVLISSPDAAHLPQMAAAVARGLHVFCEKPLCTTAAEIKLLHDVLDDASRKGLIVTSCHPRRFDTPYVWLARRLPLLRAEFGKVMNVSLDFSYHEASPEKRNLHGDSLLQDHVNHEIDYLNFMLGHDKFGAVKLVDAFDRYHLAGVRNDGVTFDFHGTRRLRDKVYPETIRVRFERAELMIDTYNQGNSHILKHETSTRVAIRPGTTDYLGRFAAINQNWVDAMAGRGDNYLTADDLILNSALSVSLHDRRSFTYKGPGLKRK